MPNPIKYSTSSETLALKKGNFWIGTGDVGKGPTSETGYWNGIDPPSGGYTIYLNKESNGPSIYVANNDSQLITLTNLISQNNYTTVTECLNYFNSQTDKLVINEDYPPIVTDSLESNIDFGSIMSYPRGGSSVNNIGGTTNAVLYNSPSFDSDGSIIFDGVNEYLAIPDTNLLKNTSNWSVSVWCYPYSTGSRMGIWGKNDSIEFGFISSTSIQLWTPVNNITINITASDYTNKWINFVCTSGDNGLRIYSNNTLIGSSASPGSGSSNDVFGIASGGYDPIGTGTYYNGKIANLQIYSRQLSVSEITKNYNAMKGKFGL